VPFEQRVQAIAPDAYPRPANLVPVISSPGPGSALVHLVLQPLNRLLLRDAAVGGQVGYGAAVDEEVVVRLEAEPDALPGYIEGYVEGRYGRYAVVLGKNVGILRNVDLAEWLARRRRRCGKRGEGDSDSRRQGAQSQHDGRDVGWKQKKRGELRQQCSERHWVGCGKKAQ
jgi:hypothetical protein